MTEPKQLPLEVRNNLLFTDHYLKERVPHQWLSERWLDAYKEAQDALTQIQDLVSELDAIDRNNEDELERVWIQPILNILGHQYRTQMTLDYGDSKFGGKTYGRPDYIFAKTEQGKASIKPDKNRPENLAHCVAAGEAKAWNKALDKSSSGEQSPAKQLEEYLYYSELSWGILTNGRIWRLYERNSSKYNSYFEVDLERILASSDINSFMYFYMFFRLDSFMDSWLDGVLEGSTQYAESLRDSLEEQVFSALEDIAQGFLDYRPNGIETPPSPEILATIYQESLVLLYRLLFIFYAESRAILPINNAGYKTRSLQRTIFGKEGKGGVIQKFNELSTFSADDQELYGKLERLFHLVDSGDEFLDVPAYNGKLFSGKDHSFLANNKVGDKHLVPALYRLATIEVKRGRQLERVAVDYQDLEVSHLGTVYEKLLEYQLDYASVPLVTSGKNQAYKKATAKQTPDKNVGDVYLRTGNNERKITGSYYTPDYIVRFIVEKTLEPLLTDITRRYAKQTENGWQVTDAPALRDAVLAVNVLDPATGSGHFAVDVVVYIAEWMQRLALDVPDNEDDELAYWMRQVAGACIYAVDINPLAVELAKLSIWLKTLARDKPLSFLDHHIRLGNSLVGSSLAEIEDLAPQKPRKVSRKKISDKQAPLFTEADFTLSVSSAVGQMNRIERVQANSVSDVKVQEQLYEELRQRLQPYEQLATVWTARHFGLDLGDVSWEAIYQLTLSGKQTPKVKQVIAEAEAIASRPDMRFFHWDVMFPEVFFDATGKRLDNAGFDAVVGNPPYVRQEMFKEIKPYLEKQYEAFDGKADTFLYFYEKGLDLLGMDRCLGFITSGTFMSTGSASKFRDLYHRNTSIKYAANFGENQPFKDAEMVFPSILIVARNNTYRPLWFDSLFIDGIEPYSELEAIFSSSNWTSTSSSVTELPEWRFQHHTLTRVFKKIRDSNPTNLNMAVGDEFYNGVKTGRSSVFEIDNVQRKHLIDEHASSADIIKPLLDGSSPRPYYFTSSDKYLVATYRGIDIDSYPAIKRYLEQHRVILEPKPNNWEDRRDGNWEGRASTNHLWYEIPVNRDIGLRFKQPKIVYPEIANLPRAAYSTNGEYTNNKCFVICQSDLSLLALLQSRVLWFYISQIANPLRLRGNNPKLWQYQLYKSYMSRLPIPDLTASQKFELEAIAESLTKLAKERYSVHENFRSILASQQGDGKPINNRMNLFQWWDFFSIDDINSELENNSSFEPIPLKGIADWRTFFNEERDKHQRLTDAIIQEEIRMNDIVYDAFGLDTAERQLIEEATKYLYGAV